MYFDPYHRVRELGSFILIDPISNATVAAGMIEGAVERPVLPISKRGPVTVDERRIRNGHGPAAVWIEGRSAAAEVLERALFDEGWNVQLISRAPEGSEAYWTAEFLHRLGIVAVFSVEDGGFAALNAIRQRFPENSIFRAPGT